MRNIILLVLCASLLLFSNGKATAESALKVLGKDYTFPNKIEGLPAKLSDFKDLEINSFQTNDGVRLSYWEAGKGKPLIFIPGWSANGAEYINVMYLLSKKYHVYVLDPRNQGLSQKVELELSDTDPKTKGWSEYFSARHKMLGSDYVEATKGFDRIAKSEKLSGFPLRG